MPACFRVSIFLCQPKVNQINRTFPLSNTYEEIIRLDITVNKVVAVEKLETLDQLVSKHEDSLKAKSPAAKVEQIFEAGAQQLQDKHVVVTLFAIPKHTRDSNTHAGALIAKDSVDSVLIGELGMTTPTRFELNCDFFICLHVQSQIDIAKGATSNFAPNSISTANSKLPFIQGWN